MYPGDLLLMLAATGVLWLGALVVPLVLAGHGRNRLALALGSAQLLFPAVFGAFGFLVAQDSSSAATHPLPEWSGFFLGWAVGVYVAAALALLGVATILWPGPSERTLER